MNSPGKMVRLIISYNSPICVEDAIADNDTRYIYCLRTFEDDPLLVEYEALELPSNWYWFIGPAEPEGGGSFREEAQARFPGHYITSLK